MPRASDDSRRNPEAMTSEERQDEISRTREGRVLQKLLDRLAEIRKELGTDQVFDVVGEVFPANLIEKLFR